MVPALIRARVLCRRSLQYLMKGDTLPSLAQQRTGECPSLPPFDPCLQAGLKEQERKEQRKIIDEQRAAGVVVVAQAPEILRGRSHRRSQ